MTTYSEELEMRRQLDTKGMQLFLEVLTWTREDLASHAVDELVLVKTSQFLSEELREMQKRALAHINALVASDAQLHVSSLRECFANQGDPSSLIAQVVADGPYMVIKVWTEATAGGLNELELTRWIHKHMGARVLELFCFDQKTQSWRKEEG